VGLREGKRWPCQQISHGLAAEICSRLRELCGERGGFEVRVPFEHLQRLMPRDGCYLHRVQPLFEQSARSLVPKIVEMKTLDLSTRAGSNEGSLYRFCGQAREHSISTDGRTIVGSKQI